MKNKFKSGHGYGGDDVVAVEFENILGPCLAIKNDSGWLIIYNTDDTPNVWEIDDPYEYEIIKEYRHGDTITITF